MSFRIKAIIGLKVVAIKGETTNKKNEQIKPEYLLFNDGETYIAFCDQDNHDYHDFDRTAKNILICSDKSEWERIMTTSKYKDANKDFDWL